jgi:ABC-2 type transport system ATP-binding protein
VLEGKVKAVKEQFKEHVYDVNFKGNMLGFTNSLWAGYELIEHHEIENGMRTARIRMLGENKVNDLMQAIMPHAAVNEISEVIPTMNDIFIKVVQGEKEVVDE